MQPQKPIPVGSGPVRDFGTAEDAAAEPVIADAEYEAFLAFQDIGAKNSERALGGRRANRPR